MQTVEVQLQSASNRAVRSGTFYGFLLGMTGAASVGALMLAGVLEGVALPCAVAAVGGGLCLLIHLLARAQRLEGWVVYASVLPLALLPTAFFLFSHLVMPAGAATFITGPFSYLSFFIIVLTGFFLDFRLAALSGVLAAGGYFVAYLLARETLGAVRAPDPTLYQDISGWSIYAIKSVMLVFTGLAVGAFAVFTRRSVLRLLEQERDKAALGRLFGQYVSEEVRDRLLRDPLASQGERREVVVLFSDIRGFTAYSEKADPEQIVDRLNVYLEGMVEAITSHSGVIDKFIGDAVMAVFGGLLPLENPCEAAVAAALSMRRRLARLNERWQAQGLSPLDNGVGVHVGEVLMGTIGSSSRKEFTVIGDTVNTASRVEGATKEHGSILVTGEVFARLPAETKNRCRALGPVGLKGRSAGVELYVVDEDPAAPMDAAPKGA